MSFLSELCSRRKALKATTTLITQADGKRFKQSSSNPQHLELVQENQYGFVVDTKPDNKPAKIRDYLYLGAQDCCDLEVLKQHKISRVLSVGIEAPSKYEGTVYKFVDCLDLEETSLEGVLLDCCSFIKDAKDNNFNVLVHCNAGVSRSASVVIGYLMLVYHYSFSDAFGIVKMARSCIKPNDGFLRQLHHLGRL